MRRLLFVAGALAILGCGSDATGPSATIDGTYDLVSVNGAALPFILIQTATETDEVTGDVITAFNGRFTQTTSTQDTVNGHVTTGFSPNSGTYTASGAVITFKFDFSPGAVMATGTTSGDTFTVTTTTSTGPFVGVYVRR